ncbi:hypothetical protein [Lentzea sp. NPDC051838]|uniref:hypothetical protein n=1 Tax=Lentzea sp. NPDC051838 TaxID=3154849 RepID=UPI00343C58DA
MEESFTLVALNERGVARSIEIELRDPPAVAMVMAVDGGPSLEFQAEDLFVCLMNARLRLEEDGFLLCCQGARPDVFPSGLLQQETGGRYAYVLTDEADEAGRPTVDIFAPADISEVATVADQRAAVMRFYGLPDRASEQP